MKQRDAGRWRGGSFIASWIVKFLLQRGYTVKASVRDPSQYSLSLSVSVSVSFKCNLIVEVPACKLIISNSHFLVVAFNRLFFIFIESFDSYQGYWRR
jgi:nucleoside-diphosphate-sugar epimerase